MTTLTTVADTKLVKMLQYFITRRREHDNPPLAYALVRRLDLYDVRVPLRVVEERVKVELLTREIM